MTPDQKGQLKDLALRFPSNIVTNADDLPEAHGFEHEIETGDAKPIMTYSYRLPHSK